MANPWRQLARAITDELDRLGQDVEGRPVVPNEVEATLPSVPYGRWSPVLAALTAELAEALADWVRRGRRSWYGGRGPYLRIRIGAVERIEVECRFRCS